jgi:enoyl-[acyl-carrier protein] reductase II
MTKQYLEKEAAGASFEELENMTLGGLRKAVLEGDVKTGSLMSGQIAGLVKESLSCEEYIRKLVCQTEELLNHE